MVDVPSSDLLRRSLDGDAEALDELLRRHLPGLRAFVRARMSALLRAHESASDLVQSACREFLRTLDRFEDRGEAAFRAWLYTAVHRKLTNKERDIRLAKRDARRQVARLSDGAEANLDSWHARSRSPSQDLLFAEAARELEAALDELPCDYREVIALSRIAQLDRRQVAEAMERSEASVRNLLHRALAALAEVLRRRETASDRGRA